MLKAFRSKLSCICTWQVSSQKRKERCSCIIFLGDVTICINNSTLCHAKQGAKVSTSLPPTLSHQCGHSAIAKIREIVITPGINLVCGFTNQGVNVNLATVTILATTKLRITLSFIKCLWQKHECLCLSCLLWWHDCNYKQCYLLSPDQGPKVSTATAAAVVTYLPTTLTHLHGERASAEMWEIAIVVVLTLATWVLGIQPKYFRATIKTVV